MPFEPISGTISAVAFVDPALRGLSWMYGKYRLMENFGFDYLALEIEYRSEVARFVQIRDQSIDLLKTSPLGVLGHFLEHAIRDRLLSKLRTLDECEEVMKKYDHTRMRQVEEKDASGSDGDNIVSYCALVLDQQQADS